MSGRSSDDRRPSDDESPRGEPAAQLSDLRRRAPTGDHRAAAELLEWARRRADEILASLSPDSELLELLRSDDPPPTSPIPRATARSGTQRGIPIAQPHAPPAPARPRATRSFEAAPAPARQQAETAPISMRARVVQPPARTTAPVAPRKATLQAPGVPRPSPDPRELILDALPPAASSDEADHARVSALRSSPVASVLPRFRPAGQPESIEPAPPARRHPRYALEQPVTIRYDEWSEVVELCTRDISKGGMFVTTSAPPPLRSKITVQLRLPRETGTLELTGEVVHVMGGGDAGPVLGFGVQFDEVSERRRAMLDRLVEHAREMAERPDAVGVTLTELGLATASGDEPSLRLTLSAEELRQLGDLRAELASMAEKDDLALLGLSGAPSPASIEEAFGALEARWHPGRWDARAVPEVEELAMGVFRRIEAAYLRVSDAARKRDAQPRTRASTPVPRTVTIEPSPASGADSVQAPQSPASGQGGIVGRLLERGGRIAERLSAAGRSAGGISRISTLEFNKLIGRGFEQLSAKEYRSAISTFGAAVKHRPDSTKAQILLLFAEARLLVADKKIAEARAKYEEVLKIDPENATARRDLVMLACVE